MTHGYWIFTWCGVCNENVVILGRRWIKHTDPRPECILCKCKRIMKDIRAEQIS